MSPAVSSGASPTLEFHLSDAEIQHRRLNELVKEVADSLRNPHTKYHVVCNCFGRLVDFARLHFADEEQFMIRQGYPEAALQQHRRAHADFLDTLAGAHRDICSGKSVSAAWVEEVFSGWFQAHHAHEDHAYVEYFRRNGR